MGYRLLVTDENNGSHVMNMMVHDTSATLEILGILRSLCSIMNTLCKSESATACSTEACCLVYNVQDHGEMLRVAQYLLHSLTKRILCDTLKS